MVIETKIQESDAILIINKDETHFFPLKYGLLGHFSDKVQNLPYQGRLYGLSLYFS